VCHLFLKLTDILDESLTLFQKKSYLSLELTLSMGKTSLISLFVG